MNVNLSNASVLNKTSVSDSSVDPLSEMDIKKFLDTLSDAFSGAQKSGKVAMNLPIGEEQKNTEFDKVLSCKVDDQDAVTDVIQVSRDGVDGLVTQDSQELFTQDQHVSDKKQRKNTTPNDDTSLMENKQGEYLHSGVEVIKKVNPLSSASLTTNGAKVMVEGQQLLGRIEQANQTLNANHALTDSGKILPQKANLAHLFHDQATVSTNFGELALNETPSVHLVEQAQVMSGPDLEPILDKNGQPIDVDKLSSEFAAWQDLAKQASNSTTKRALSDDVVNELSPLLTDFDGSNIDVLPRVSLHELDAIDIKLVQGKALTQQEVQIIEGLKQGTITTDILEHDLPQFVALPSDVKQIITEQQVQHNSTRQAAPMTVSQQVNHIVTQAPQPHAVHMDNATFSPMPDALVAAQVSTSLQGMKDEEISQKVMNSALGPGGGKVIADKQDKPEPQYGFAGQLQAMTGQNGSNIQQVRIDTAQQIQYPLQLTKELANEQIAEKVQMMMSKNLKNLDIRLDPPELGRMQIRMMMNNDTANVHFTVNNPQARDMIEQTLPRLRDMLAQQGMQLADSSVQQQNSGQQHSRYTAEQHNQSAQGDAFSEQYEEGFEAGVNLDLNVDLKRDGISFYA